MEDGNQEFTISCETFQWKHLYYLHLSGLFIFIDYVASKPRMMNQFIYSRFVFFTP